MKTDETETEQPKLYAWYSAKQAKNGGTFLYAREDGSEVECSSVTDGETHNMGFDDVNSLGPVAHFIKRATDTDWSRWQREMDREMHKEAR